MYPYLVTLTNEPSKSPLALAATRRLSFPVIDSCQAREMYIGETECVGRSIPYPFAQESPVLENIRQIVTIITPGHTLSFI